MDEAAIKLETRLFAIEHLLANVFKIAYRLSGASEAEIQATHAKLRASLKTESIPGLDAASSDLWAAEIEEAVDALLTLINDVRSEGKAR
jgi:hypothetical protein